MLVQPPFVSSVDWSKWYVFWVDERIVPKYHEKSNYRLAYDGFLSKVILSSSVLLCINALNDTFSGSGRTFSDVWRYSETILLSKY